VLIPVTFVSARMWEIRNKQEKP